MPFRKQHIETATHICLRDEAEWTLSTVNWQYKRPPGSVPSRHLSEEAQAMLRRRRRALIVEEMTLAWPGNEPGSQGMAPVLVAR